MKKINPIYLLIAFNVLVFLVRDLIVPEETMAAVGADFEAVLASLGAIGYVSIVGIYTLCAFFFVPLLIPLNIACGAMYGPYAGTLISIVGITIGCFASTISVRYVFTGMQKSVESRPAAKKILGQVSRHGAVMVLVVRLAFIVPYLIQNIVLAATTIGIYRLAALTALGSLPGAAIYSFLGAGLVQSETADQLALYLAVPLVLIIALTIIVKRLNARYDTR